jgi:hypothetical protein
MDAKASNNAEMLPPLFLISDAEVGRMCSGRARHNNGIANQCGQPQRVTASELRDLYYNAGGRCVMCTDALEIHTIQLDHIVEARRRAALSARIANEKVEFGAIADISNLQWVCKKCNALKELCRRNGINLTEYVARVADQAATGFPIRANAKHLGARGHAAYRREFILKMIAEDDLVSSRAVHEALNGTPGEACYQTVLEEMKALGWRDQRKGSYREKREAAIRDVVQQHGTHYDTLLQFAELVVTQLKKMGTTKHPAPQIVKETALAMNLAITFDRVQKRLVSPSAGDKAALMEWLRCAGDDGAFEFDIVEMLCKRGLSESSARNLIEEMKQSQIIYQEDASGVFIASLTRQEAANRIGVSKNMLKRWASNEFAGSVASPVFSKGESKKSCAWYRRDDVDAFVARRDERKNKMFFTLNRLA